MVNRYSVAGKMYPKTGVVNLDGMHGFFAIILLIPVSGYFWSLGVGYRHWYGLRSSYVHLPVQHLQVDVLL